MGKMKEITKVDRDILYTRFLLEGKNHQWYDKVYYSTNEDLNSLLSSFNLGEKDVLSVAGSGDQAFHFYSAGANKIDLFDINRLTIHYYYLRTWVLKYLDSYYPNKDFATYVDELLERVKPNSEEEQDSLMYWKKFVKRFSKDKIIKLFCSSSLCDSRDFSGNIDGLKKIISNKKTHFYDMDISELIDIDIQNKYDVIYVSNIRDWINRRNKSWEIYCDNLYNLLNDNGVVINSSVVNEYPYYGERRIFEKKFEDEQLEKNKTYSIFEFNTPGYVYIKK